MLRLKDLETSPRRVFLTLGVAALFAAASPARAEEESSAKATATSYVWSALGAGQVGVADDTKGGASGSNYARAHAQGLLATANGYVSVVGTESDASYSVRAQTMTSYQLDVAACADATVTWNATGSMQWSGHAWVDTFLDADASASGIALLAYSGDLNMTHEAAVAAGGSGTGTSEVAWEISLTPSYTKKFTRAQQAKDDSCVGNAFAENSGSGGSVRVSVFAYAKADLAVDSNAFGMGWGKAGLGVTNVGSLALAVTVTEPPASSEGTPPTTGGGDGGGPSTGGPDDDDHEPATGGEGGTGVVTPRVRKFRIRIGGCGLPFSADGPVTPSTDFPSAPKDTQESEPAAGGPSSEPSPR